MLSPDEFKTKTIELDNEILRKAVRLGRAENEHLSARQEAVAIDDLLNVAVTQNLIHMSSGGMQLSTYVSDIRFSTPVSLSIARQFLLGVH